MLGCRPGGRRQPSVPDFLPALFSILSILVWQGKSPEPIGHWLHNSQCFLLIAGLILSLHRIFFNPDHHTSAMHPMYLEPLPLTLSSRIEPWLVYTNQHLPSSNGWLGFDQWETRKCLLQLWRKRCFLIWKFSSKDIFFLLTEQSCGKGKLRKFIGLFWNHEEIPLLG